MTIYIYLINEFVFNGILNYLRINKLMYKFFLNSYEITGCVYSKREKYRNENKF